MIYSLFMISLFANLKLATRADSLNNNVIVFILDDLSPFYLDPTHIVKMPNLKKLTSRGIEFHNAHTAFPVCGPSRIAMMTGRYADKTKLFTFERVIPQVPGLTSVTRYLTDHHINIDTIGFGKILHDDKNGPKDPISISFHSHYTLPFEYGGSEDGECMDNWFCVYRDEKTIGDYKLATSVINHFRTKGNSKRTTVALVGFRKPHIELGVPKKYLDLVNRSTGMDSIQHSEPSSVSENGLEIDFRSALSRYQCGEIKKRHLPGMRIPNTDLLVKNRNSSTPTLEQIRKFYFAASMFVDAMMGRVVDYIENTARYSNNTAFVVVSDLGFSNAEHNVFLVNVYAQ